MTGDEFMEAAREPGTWQIVTTLGKLDWSPRGHDKNIVTMRFQKDEHRYSTSMTRSQYDAMSSDELEAWKLYYTDALDAKIAADEAKS